MTETSTLEGVPGVVTSAQLAQTAAFLASLQLPSGQVPWFEGGHCDPWNHVESAMALTVTGWTSSARAAYQWLARRQLGDGSWFNYYRGDTVINPRLDTNVCAYIATGLYHYWLVTGDAAFVSTLWPTLERAIEFVLRHQRPDATVRWSLDGRGRRQDGALLTGSSSIFHSLRCAVALGDVLGETRPTWELAAGRLAHVLVHHREGFLPKDEFAMDWYYPVLSGALVGDQASARLDQGRDTFVMPGRGVRCVSTHDWVTAAETAECVLALDAVGRRSEALELFTYVGLHRRDDGAYLTGLAYPHGATFPHDEVTSYSAAAVILAADALTDSTPGAGLFRHGTLGPVEDWPEVDCPLRH